MENNRSSRGAFARSFGDFGFFEGGHDGYDAIGCTHRRALLFFGRELVVVIDFVGVSRPVASLLSVVQCGAGTLEEIADRQFLFTGTGDSLGCSLRFLGTRPFACSMREGTICPDYNKAIPAPRIELAEERVDGDRVLVSLLGPDASLLGSFTMGRGASVNGRSTGKVYEISFPERGNNGRTSEEDAGGIVCRVAGESEEMVLLRNARVVRAASGEVRFESESALEFCAAVARGGTLEMMIEKQCHSFFVPRTVDTLIVNGETRPFIQENGWIRTNV